MFDPKACQHETKVQQPVSAEYLAFTLGQEEYGVAIQSVQELRGYDAVTHIANAPAYIKGVVNLRGVIVPIIDMRMKFGLADPSYNELTVVIILNIGNRVMGMVVDSVSDVTALTAEQVKPPPEVGLPLEQDYVTGLGLLGERMLILVDIEKIMTADDVGVMARLAA